MYYGTGINIHPESVALHSNFYKKEAEVNSYRCSAILKQANRHKNTATLTLK